MSTLMPLLRLAGVSNFRSNLLLPFLSIVHILSSQTISLQILLYVLFQRFPWLTLLPFLSYFNFHSFMSLGIDVSTHDMTVPRRRLWIIMSSIFTTTPTLSRSTSFDTLSTSLTPHIILIIRRCSPRNLASCAAVNSHVSQQ